MTAGAISFPDPELQSQRIRLRQWSFEDVAMIVAACQHPSIAEFSPAIPYPYTDKDAIGWIESQEPTRLAGEEVHFAIVRTGSNVVVGAIGLTDFEMNGAHVGYWLANSARGHGYMTDALRLVTNWAFDQLELSRVSLITDPENVASQKVAERCGFRHEGLMRSQLLVRHSGQRRDALIYGLLPDDPRS